MKIAIVGSRKYPNPELVRRTVTLIHQKDPTTLIVSGAADGPDSLAVNQAKKLGLPTQVFPAQWKRPDGSTNYQAGYDRNPLIIYPADLVIAFYDGSSKGTLDSLHLANHFGKKTLVYDANGNRIDPLPLLQQNPWRRTSQQILQLETQLLVQP